MESSVDLMNFSLLFSFSVFSASIGLMQYVSLFLFKSHLILQPETENGLGKNHQMAYFVKLNRFSLYCVETLGQMQEENPVILSNINHP